MAKRLFVGGLAYSVTDQELTDLFSKHGKVASANIISDKFTNQSKGFGFVEMEDDAEADAAIKALNETEYQGRKITVNVARPREERPQFDRSRSGGFDHSRRGGFRN